VSSRDINPEHEAADLHSGQKRGGAFGVSGGDAAPFFEVAHGVFYQMAQFVEVRIVFSLHFAVLARWNLPPHSLFGRLRHNRVRIITIIRKQIIGLQVLDQLASLRTICHETRCNKDSDRHTMRIHGQMQLGVEPPFVRPIS